MKNLEPSTGTSDTSLFNRIQDMNRLGDTHVEVPGSAHRVPGKHLLGCVESQMFFLCGEFRAKGFSHSFMFKE